MQHLLGRARWDADAVRDDLRDYVVEHLGGPGAVLVIDETGDVKKGHRTAGVQRQYTGTAGRIENAQVAVYLTYAAAAGHAAIDRELYLPRSWTGNPARCRAAGIPDGTAFATKPKLARRMIARTLDAGAPAEWVAGDEVYGADPGLRGDLESRGTGYVLAVAKSHRVNAGAGACRADALAARLPRSAWQRYSAGAGAKGHRLYDWAWAGIDHGRPGHRWLLIRRNYRTAELAFYRCYAPRHVSLAALAKVAGRRWTVEEDFQAGKGLAGLDEHQVGRQGAGRPGRAPGPPLELLAPLGHPGHARRRVPDHHRRRRARQRPAARRPDPAHPQRDQPPVRHPDHLAATRPLAPAPLVRLAKTPPAPRPNMPLPATSPRTMTITIYGWSTSGACLPGLSLCQHDSIRTW
jgi:SRSO17 transposase